MNRGRFLAGTGAVAYASASAAAPGAQSPAAFDRIERLRPGARLSLAEMLTQYPVPNSGDLLHYELGFGAAYDKQIGFGHETDGDERYLFVESQVGNGDHACNPNTLKKVYLKSRAFAGIFTPYAALTYVTRSGNMLTRWGDGVGPSAANLLLLDAKALYDPRRATVTAVTQHDVRAGGKSVGATRVRARYAGAATGQLSSVDVWLSADVPLGLVKMSATSPDLDPFHLSLYTFASHFRSELAMSLQTVRALTPTGDVPVIQ